MAKKIKKDIEDDFENESEFTEDLVEDIKDDVEDEVEEDSCESGIKINDDDDNIDIIIEIDDDDLDLTSDFVEKVSEDVDAENNSDVVLSKHKLEGKHSLKYDSIFKGKKDDPIDESDVDSFTNYHKDSIEVDKSSHYYAESVDNESYVRQKLVKERVYTILSEHTSINFLNNRRKPSRNDFNQYYGLLSGSLKEESFTNIELYIEELKSRNE